MKKLFSAVCIIFCLLFSSAATAVRADDGDGHAPGYVCVATAGCPPNAAPPKQPSGTSGPNNGTTATAADTSLILLELIIALLPKS